MISNKQLISALLVAVIGLAGCASSANREAMVSGAITVAK